MVEAGGVEPPSARDPLQPLRACSVYYFSPRESPADRLFPSASAHEKVSPSGPGTQPDG